MEAPRGVREWWEKMLGIKVMLGPRVRVKILWNFIKPTCGLGARGGKLQGKKKKKKKKGLLKNQFITQLKLRDILWDQKRLFSALKAFSLPNFKSAFVQLLELIPKKTNPILGITPSMEVWVAKWLLLRHSEGLSSDFFEV